MAHDHLLESKALEGLNKTLGATGGQQHTRIDSDNLQLALNANDIVRRGRTFAASSGIFTGMIPNTHGVPAATVTTIVDPYALTSPTAGFPTPLPEGFDVWLLGSTAWRQSGDALVSATLRLSYPATAQATGTPGSQIFVARAYQIATLSELTIGVIPYFRSIGDGLIGATHAIRIPRGATIVWGTSGAGGAAAEYRVLVVLGVFPAGLGQDAVGAG